MGMTAQVIREKRQARGETLETVARACGLNTGTMWRIESGRVNPRLATLGSFDFRDYNLTEFVRQAVVPYLEDENQALRAKTRG
mgnify:CR=1 FL=1